MDSIRFACDTINVCQHMKCVRETAESSNCDWLVTLIVCFTIFIIVAIAAVVVLLWHRRIIRSQMEMEEKRSVWKKEDNEAIIKLRTIQDNRKFIQMLGNENFESKDDLNKIKNRLDNENENLVREFVEKYYKYNNDNK